MKRGKPRPIGPRRRPPIPEVPVVSSAPAPAEQNTPPQDTPREGTDLSDETIRKMLEAAYT